MKNLLPLVVFVPFLASGARAAALQPSEAALPRDSARSAVTPEATGSGVAAGFDQALQTQTQAFNSQIRVNLYGNVTLRGSAFILVPNPLGVSVPMSGQANISGAGQLVQTGYVTINHTEQVRLQHNQNYVSQMARVQANVPLYCRGQYVGTGTVSGSFMVMGYRSGNYLSLQGSGSLTGSAFVTCPDQTNSPVQPRSPGLPGHAVDTQPQ